MDALTALGVRQLRRDPAADLMASLDLRPGASVTDGGALNPLYALSDAVVRDPRSMIDPRRGGGQGPQAVPFPPRRPENLTPQAQFQPMAADPTVQGYAAAPAMPRDNSALDQRYAAPQATPSAYDPENESPVGLAPGRMPVDPARDGSVQPTEAGRRLQGNVGNALAALGGGVAGHFMAGPNFARDFLDGKIDPHSLEAVGGALRAVSGASTGGFGIVSRAAAPAARAASEALPAAAREAVPAARAIGPYGNPSSGSVDDAMAAIQAGIRQHSADPMLGRVVAPPTSSPLSLEPYGAASNRASTDDGMEAIRAGIMRYLDAR